VNDDRMQASRGLPIFQVDAFTDIPFGGNPAGVVPDADGLTEKQMQAIAREMNLSETAFVLKPSHPSADFRVRFFTPTGEVDLCGHATVGTFFVLSEEGVISLTGDITQVIQETLAGLLPVEIHRKEGRVTRIMMHQRTPKILGTLEETEELCDILKLSKGHVWVEPQVVSTGLPDLMLPVKTLEALWDMKPDMNRLARFSNQHGFLSVHAFTMETKSQEATAHCRDFAPSVGINEEAATGTASGALAAYLVLNGIITEPNPRMLFEQGYVMDRPSRIFVEVQGTPSGIDMVKVGGSAVTVMRGSIYL